MAQIASVERVLSVTDVVLEGFPIAPPHVVSDSATELSTYGRPPGPLAPL